ncbi:MAG TPA: tRNA threonylcarbamoyladenosine biosynthesis protein RimN [Oceanospirillaceae bacterium]|nr:tRNA threonylcarbamoyladenosine biosynthesis protein RimN [Oceanospirillaceae bacterium]
MQPSYWHLQCATQNLTFGGVIAYPTEAVWGFGCDPWDDQAVARILNLKQRPMHKGLILVASQWSQLRPLMQHLSSTQIEQLRQTWPGPTTWLLPDPESWVPPWIKGQHTSVAIRVSAHPVVQALCDSFGGPIVSTSANVAGRNPAMSRLHIEQRFGGELDYVLNGPLGQNKQPSQVKDLVSGRIIRPA